MCQMALFAVLKYNKHFFSFAWMVQICKFEHCNASLYQALTLHCAFPLFSLFLQKTEVNMLLFIADNLACFPYQSQEEPLFIMHHIDITLSVSGSNLLQTFKEVR